MTGNDGSWIGVLEPRAGIEMETRGDAFRARLQRRRQRGEQLEPRGRERIGEAELRGGAGQSGEEQRFGFRTGLSPVSFVR